jgi:hypothetical protein
MRKLISGVARVYGRPEIKIPSDGGGKLPRRLITR